MLICDSTTYIIDRCRDLDALVDRLDHSSYWVSNNFIPREKGGCEVQGGDYQGGWGVIIWCYNCNQIGHRESVFPFTLIIVVFLLLGEKTR